MTDTTWTTNHTLDGLRIAEGDRLIFDPASNVTLTINVNYAHTNAAAADNNIVVEGELVMHPNSNRTHKIVFAGIEEHRMLGGTVADHMNPPTTDPGIYVVMSGKLDLVGTTKTAWTNEATDPGDWSGTDVLMKAPWGIDFSNVTPENPPRPFTEASSYTMGDTIDTYTTNDGTLHYRERFNMTRNVIIEATGGTGVKMVPGVAGAPGTITQDSTVGGFGHIMIMSDQPQTIKYVKFNNWGPAIFSRWTIHFHLVGAGSEGTEITGCIANESKGHVYVPHGSYGITFFDCVAYHARGDVFWYDEIITGPTLTVGFAEQPPGLPPPKPGGIVSGATADYWNLIRDKWNAPHDLLWDKCGVFSSLDRVSIVWPTDTIHGPTDPSFGIDPNSPATAGIGFWLAGVRENFNPVCRNCVVAGTKKDSVGSERAAFNWAASAPNNFSEWTFHDNVAHNTARAFAQWNNNRVPHFFGWETPPSTELADVGDPMDPNEVIGKTGFSWYTGGFRATSLLNGAYANHLHVAGMVADYSEDTGGGEASANAVTGRLKPTQSAHNGQIWFDCHFDFVMSGAEARPVLSQDFTTFISCVFGTFSNREELGPTGTPIAELNTYFTQAHQDDVAAAGGDDFLDNEFGGKDGGRTIRHDEAIYQQFVNCTFPGPPIADGGTVLDNVDIFGKNPDSIFRVQQPDGSAFHVKPGWGTFPAVYSQGTHRYHSGNGTETWEAVPPFWPYISNAGLANGIQGSAYNQTLVAQLAVEPLVWSVHNGSTLPPGLTINNSTGAITGTPTTPGAYTFTLRCRDSEPGHQSRLFTREYSMSVVASNVLTITTSSLAGAVVGTAYNQTVTAVGGTAPRTFAVLSGSLPGGLSLSSGGAITGTPTTAGIYNFTVRVTDNVAATDDQPFQITVAVATPTITTAALPLGNVGVAYSFQMSAIGGTTPYTWSLIGGQLPAGLTLASNGLISGTPQAAQTRHPTLRVTDGAAQTDEHQFIFQITVEADFAEFVNVDPPDGKEGEAYSYQFTAQGGSQPYLFIVDSGNPLPEGLTLTTAGLLSGTPTEGGTFDFVVGVIDVDGHLTTEPVQIVFAESEIIVTFTEHVFMQDSNHRDMSVYDDEVLLDDVTTAIEHHYAFTFTETVGLRDDSAWPFIYTLGESAQMRDDDSWSHGFAAIHAWLPMVTQSMEGATVSGDISSTLPALTQSLLAVSGDSVAGGIVSSLPALTSAMVGGSGTGGLIDSALAALTQSMEMDTSLLGDIDSTLPVLTQAMVADVEQPKVGSIEQELPAFTQSMFMVTVTEVDDLYEPYSAEGRPRLATPQGLAAYLGVSISSDDLLANLICYQASDIVRTYVEQLVHFVNDEAVDLHGSGSPHLVLPQVPVVRISEIVISDTGGANPVALEDSEWILEKSTGIVHLVSGVWPLGYENVHVVYDHGWDVGIAQTSEDAEDNATAHVPADILAVALRVAARLYASGGALGVGGISGTVNSETIGPETYSYTNETSTGTESQTVGDTGLTWDEMALLAHYRMVQVA